MMTSPLGKTLIMYQLCTVSHCIILLLSFILSSVVGEISLTVTAPVPDPEENGVFSIHCQVSGLQPGQGKEVTIHRQLNGYPERLSLETEVLRSTLEDRGFLATRHIEDGDVVYFLSVMDVQRGDGGEYTCEVISASRTEEVLPIGSVNIRVMYFPTEGSLKCPDPPSSPLHVGDTLLLNCNSEAAYPTVNIAWTRTSALDPRMRSVSTTISGNRINAVMTHIVTSEDDETMFICSVTSAAFPGPPRTCHVGPIHVVQGKPGNNVRPVDGDDTADNHPSNQPKIPPVAMDIFPNSRDSDGDHHPDITTLTKQDCRSKCSTLDGSVMMWVITTIVAGIFALTFLIIVIVLFSKYRSSLNSSSTNHQYTTPMMYHTEKVYDEVGGYHGVNIKHDEGMSSSNQRNIVYMSLEKRPDPLLHHHQHDAHDYIGTTDRRL